MKTTVWYLLVICLIKVKEMVNYIFAQIPYNLPLRCNIYIVVVGNNMATGSGKEFPLVSLGCASKVVAGWLENLIIKVFSSFGTVT